MDRTPLFTARRCSAGSPGAADPQRRPDGGRLRRAWAAVWLPLLLVGLAVVLGPRVNGFLLGLLLLVVALATTWLRDVACELRKARRGGSPPR
jgi:hypothetical protein